MNLQKAQDRINELMSIFVSQVKGATAMGRTDINRVSETVLIPLFSSIFGFKKLRNLNFTESPNFPGIDLADDNARVAFQITSTSTSEKVKNTLQTFVEYQLYKRYDRLIIYILTEKQKSYAADTLKQTTNDTFSFQPERDILDYRDLLKTIAPFQLDKARIIQNILEANFAEGAPLLFIADEEAVTETVHLNLLEINFPDVLYMADFVDDRKGKRQRIKTRGKVGGHPKRYRNTPRERVQAALAELGLRFSLDWEVHENRIITFHDLNNEDLPLSAIIDKGTVAEIAPDEFYGANDSYERVFKSFLSRCLQQKLYHRQVHWQNEAKLFIFSEVDNMPERVEKWRGKRESERTVYERIMKTHKPEEIFYCKHLAFRTQYKYFGDKWYLLIKPEWFFSHDGYKSSFYGADKIDWLKRREGNAQVVNHLNFIAYFLKHDRPPDLLTEGNEYPFLSFGELNSFDNAPVLIDSEWNPPDTKVEDDEPRKTDEMPLF